MKKKVMLIHHCGSIGGAGVSCYNTVKSLARNYDVTVYVPEFPNDFYEFLVSKKINVKKYNIPLGGILYYSGGPALISKNFITNIINIKKYKYKWENIIINEGPNLVIVNSKTTAWLSEITKKLKIKSICFVRETRPSVNLLIYEKMQRKHLDNFDKVIFISKYDLEKEDLKRAKSILMPNFVDLTDYEKQVNKKQIFNEFKIKEDSFKILFVGGVASIKGIKYAVKSLKYLKQYNINLIIAGNTKFIYRKNNNLINIIYNRLKKRYENTIRKEIKRYKLNDFICDIGLQTDMNKVYSISDVLIFPANKPHQARPLFEAGAKKVPVIMPNFKNTFEYVTYGYNGFIFKKRNAKNLAKEIEKLILDIGLCKNMGENNYKETKKKHNIIFSEKILHKELEELFFD